MATMQPISPAERIHIIDVLRGAAIFGVLVVNMLLDFSGYASAPEQWSGSLDQSVVTLTRIFFRFKFVSLLSMLFGLGFFLFVTRTEFKRIMWLPLYLRRVLILLFIGVLHALLMPNPSGEVLHQYALMGFFLPLFRNRSNRLILVVAVALMALPFGVQEVVNRNASARAASEVARTVGAESAEERPTATWPPTPDPGLYVDGSFSEIVDYHGRTLLSGRTSPIAYVWMLQVLSLFLLGLVVARAGLFENVSVHRRLFRRVVWLGFPFGLALTLTAEALGRMASPRFGLVAGLCLAFGAPLLTASYVGVMVLASQRTVGKKLLAPLAAVGRTALSNFPLQTLICTSIFFGYGLGLYRTVSPVTGLMLTIAIFASQMVISSWWVERFRFGPAEWLWRTLTYGRLQELRYPVPVNS